MDIRELDPSIDAWAAAGMDVADIGYTEGKDLDLVVVGPGEGPDDSVQNLSEFCAVASEMETLGGISVIIRQDHFAYAEPDKLIIHLLFYPTKQHLIAWELPSFCASLAATAEFLAGSAQRYEDRIRAYILRNIEEPPDMTRRHMLAYGSIACAGAVYSSGIPTDVPKAQLCILFKYALRFSLAEILQPALASPDAGLWSLASVREALEGLHPGQSELQGVLGMTCSELERCSPSQLASWFSELFTLTEHGRSFLERHHLFAEEALP